VVVLVAVVVPVVEDVDPPPPLQLGAFAVLGSPLMELKLSE
jgi:hypothetical protein